MKKLVKTKTNKKGFTLMEVIVVIAIIAVLAVIAIPSIAGYIKEAEDQKYITIERAAYTDAVFEKEAGAGLRPPLQTIGVYEAGKDKKLGTEDDIFTVGSVGGLTDPKVTSGEYKAGTTVKLFAKDGPIADVP